MCPASIDNEDFDFRDRPTDPMWAWYTLKWKWGKLREQVISAHRKGLKVRVYNVPSNRKVWDYLRKMGVDLIGTDHLKKFRDYLRP